MQLILIIKLILSFVFLHMCQYICLYSFLFYILYIFPYFFIYYSIHEFILKRKFNIYFKKKKKMYKYICFFSFYILINI
ncbi:hypothetical protein PFUGPA_03263 [Plasmodium falciparum Palo Alto/Uganda]|uniref:Uncharacterized protein n=1 Tax=Plasmodium falciparum (isolate Palo Alto / Uganda) TaxID=57270 RepID=W4IXA4_PLAFP|nr:hypothetical protein PFUGPA_03263 [Plasmodium falciparum Palo Alto/Uganda]